MDSPVPTGDLTSRTNASRLPIRIDIALALAVGIGLLGAIFFDEISSAVEVWNASTAYSHCYLILPMALYLLWDRRETLSACRAQPEIKFALAGLPLALVWIVAERLGIMEGRQLAFIGGIQILLLTVLGRRFYRKAAAPLLFLVFLVPFGAFLTPLLQRFTAGFSIIGLDLLGIPNFADRFTIETPAGVFFVAEACAGLRFLIAAVAFGVFYAILNYRSPTRRVGFIVASIVVPIVANGVRALGIIVLGQILGSAQAAAADHIVYGWIFFSIVMLLLIAAGQVFREPSSTAVSAAMVSARMGQGWSPILAAVALVVAIGSGPAIAAAIDLQTKAPSFPETAVLRSTTDCVVLPPEKAAANEQRLSVNCRGTMFGGMISLFPPRSTSGRLINQRRRVSQEVRAEDSTIAPVQLPEGVGSWTVVQTTDPDRVTAYASWVDGEAVRSGFAGRIAQARDSIFGTRFAPALVTLTAAEAARKSPAQRKATLDLLILFLGQQTSLDATMAKLTKIGPL